MAERIELSDEQISDAIKNGEFGNDVLCSKKNVAVIMSQSWCPQWSMLNRWLDAYADNPDIDIYVVVYDKKNYFREFLHFKETVFGNDAVPYIRYYIGGKLVKETNYTSKDFFCGVFGLKYCTE
jgi:hypothetical protein